MNAVQYIQIIIVWLFLLPVIFSQDNATCFFATFQPHTISLPLNSNGTFYVALNQPSANHYNVSMMVEDAEVISLRTDVVTIPPNWAKAIKVQFSAKALKSNIFVAENKTNWSNECLIHETDPRTFLLVTVFRLESFILVADILGWIYFSVWTISFWPQIILNFKRKSVVGLHFDFLALNATGFLFYSVYNVAMYTIPKVQQEYLEAVPNSVNPVQIQDVAFAVHGFVATLFTIVQCFIYERGEQRISRVCTVLLILAWGTALIAVIIAAVGHITWFIYVTLISYTKLVISIVKYVPQVVFNYRRKTTEGFSIGAIFMDFVGSIGSMLQMIVIAYNMDEWTQFFGDFTKFGLGLQSLVFDIIFFVQRYGLYGSYTEMAQSISTIESQSKEEVEN